MPGMPASVSTISPSVKHLQQVYYDKLVVENHKANTPALELCDMRSMPKRSGRTIQTFGYTPFGPSNTKAAEGLTGAGLPLSSVTASAFLDQYVDYISFSDVVESTSIDPIVANGAGELAYRGALTINQVVFNIFDASVSVDSKTSMDLLDNEFLSGSVVRRATFSLDAANIRRREGGMFHMVAHPLSLYDLFQDNAAGSPVDVIKRGDAGQAKLQRSGGNYQVLDWADARIIRTTTVPTYANFPSTGKTGYAAYVVGHEAFIASSMYNEKLPKDKNFQVMVSYFNTATPDNPALQTSAAVAFNFLFGVTVRPNTDGSIGYRRIRSEASIV